MNKTALWTLLGGLTATLPCPVCSSTAVGVKKHMVDNTQSKATQTLTNSPKQTLGQSDRDCLWGEPISTYENQETDNAEPLP